MTRRASAGRTGLLRRIRSDEAGSALVLVVGSMLILAMLALTALAYSLSSQRLSRYDQDYSAAMSAAQSGVEEFISRLNRTDVYAAEVDCTNTAWKGPTTVTNLCGWNDTTAPGWLPVDPDETDPDAAWFHYAVDTARRNSEGTIVLTVTGRVNGVNRTIEVAVGKGGSTDYVYYTDFESADPTNVQAYPPNGTTTTACGASTPTYSPKYWYNGRQGKGCTEIQFASRDVLDGPVFTNDAIYSVGGTFKMGVETAYPTCKEAGASEASWNSKCLRSGTGTTNTANFNGTKPKYHDPLYLEENSAAFATYPGCHYKGSTRIIFNANGTMTVWNKAVNNLGVAPEAITAPGGVTPSCGSLTDLDSGSGATVPVPEEMVVYVDDADPVPGVSLRRCYAGEIGGPPGRTLPLGTFAEVNTADPTAAGQSYTVDTNMTEGTKYCGQGNLYLEGVLKGRVTVASQQSIIATGDIVLAGGPHGSDMLGLVATNSVDVFHPRVGTVTSVKRDSSCTRSCAYKWGDVAGVADVASWPTRYTDPAVARLNPSSGIQIAGSIQTLQHSFLVQKYGEGGSQGTLLVYGSIAQRWRGIVGTGTGTTGYIKLYQYDTRLTYSSPPYFPKWAKSQWKLRYSGEITTPDDVRGSAP